MRKLLDNYDIRGVTNEQLDGTIEKAYDEIVGVFKQEPSPIETEQAFSDVETATEAEGYEGYNEEVEKNPAIEEVVSGDAVEEEIK